VCLKHKVTYYKVNTAIVFSIKEYLEFKVLEK
jgi:hypothetical protein